jgi:hypothetical protein
MPTRFIKLLIIATADNNYVSCGWWGVSWHFFSLQGWLSVWVLYTSQNFIITIG